LRLVAVSAVGLGLFFWPFLGTKAPPETLALAAALACLAVLLALETGARHLDSRGLALLAALAAIDAALRMAVVAGLAGFNPIFFMIICAGFVFGPTYGFLVGSSSLLVSGFTTGGLGPWLPYQMFGAAWVGAVSGLVGLRWEGRSGPIQLVVLAAAGAVLGFAFGALMDIHVWVFGFRGSPGLGWSPGMDPLQALGNFGRFYLLTSLAYDSFRAAGNALLVLTLGPAVITALGRVRRRLSFAVV
jgi:energy-coupling factor transport system substrate-specific component